MSLSVVLTILALILLTALFAAYELALASVRPGRLKVLAEQKKRGAATALLMKERIEQSLAALQLGMTLTAVIAAATGGASAEEKLAPLIKEHLHLPEPYDDIVALICFVVPLAALTTIVGELVPKVLAIKYPEWVCVTLSPVMRGFSIIIYPMVLLFEWCTNKLVNAIERFLPRQKAEDHTAGLHELRAQVNLLRASQAIGVQEERIILQASRLSAMKVQDIMMPEDDIVMVVADAPLSENLVIAHMDMHTRFPVTTRKGDPEGIIGYVTFKDMVLLAKTHPGNPVIREIVRHIISLSEDMALSEALKRMIAEHHHLALVRDGDGKVVGMIAQEDIFEELVGDIQD